MVILAYWTSLILTPINIFHYSCIMQVYVYVLSLRPIMIATWRITKTACLKGKSRKCTEWFRKCQVKGTLSSKVGKFGGVAQGKLKYFILITGMWIYAEVEPNSSYFRSCLFLVYCRYEFEYKEYYPNHHSACSLQNKVRNCAMVKARIVWTFPILLQSMFTIIFKLFHPLHL